MRKILTFIGLCMSLLANAQTYTFECVGSSRLSGDSCDICPSTIIESRSFNGLVIYRDSAFYRWIDQPYSIRVKPGGLIEYWEHSVNPYSERVTIPLVATGFFTIQGMADSTWCMASAPDRYQFLDLDSISTTKAAFSLTGDPTDEYLEEGTGITFSYEGDTLTISSTGGGGSATDLSYSIGGSPVTLFSSTGADVGIIAGTGIGLSSTATDLTITNSAPDQTVSLTQGGTTVITGTYPNFTITSNDAFVGTVTSVSSGNLSPLFNVTVGTPTTTPAFSFAQINQNANLVFAGPATGAAAAPTFRALVAADIPAASASKWTDAGVYTYLTSTTDRAVVGSATELNTSYILQAKGGLFVQGAGSTSGTYAGIFEKADGTDIMNIRNDGRVGILNSAPAYALDVVGDISIDQPSAYYIATTKGMYGKPASDQYFFAGAGNVTGSATKNIGIGPSALLSFTTGINNVCMGYHAGRLIQGGQGNVAIGTEALKTNVSGNNNFALGTEALKLNTASNNVAVGGLSQPSTSTGEKNVSLGYFSLNGNTTGFENVAMGNVALQLNQDGYRNIGIGSEALLSNVSGFGNVAIGSSALYSTTGSRNTVVGYASGLFLTTGSQNIVIGASLRPINDAGSNQMTIGNIIYATGVDGTGTTVSTGYVGIKTNAPSQALHVAGNLRVTGAYYDSNNDPGTAGQVMSSTATGTDWVAAATSYTDEQAQDAVGTILVDSPQIDFTYNDATPSITATVIDESITYAKIQNVAANNVLLGNDSGAGADVQELSTAEVQTMLGYIDGAGANQRIAYFTDANTLAAEAAFIYDAANDRQTITAATPGLGAGAAILNLTNTGPDGTGEFLQIRGDISVNLLSGMTNTNTGATANTIWNVTQSGNSAGDAYIQTQISGTGGNTTSFGLDNSDANKFKITPNGNSPGVNANASLVATNDAIPLWGVNKDAPAFPLDVGGKDRSEQYHGINVAWATGDFFFGLGAGTSPTFTAMSGTHNFVKVEFSTGTSPTANNAIFSIVRKAGYEFSTKAFPVFCAGNANAAGEIAKFYMSSDDGVTMTMTANGTLTASTAYVFYIGFSGY